MIRRPSIDTFLNLWVTSRFDLRNGSFFDLATHRPKTRTRALMKSFDYRKVADNGTVDRLMKEGFFEKLFGTAIKTEEERKSRLAFK